MTRAADLPLGAADCEAWRAGLLGQPTNAISALAFVVAAAWLISRVRGTVRPPRWPALLVAVAVAATGVGSVLYHGVGGRVAHVLHDLSVAAVVAALLVVEVARGRRTAPRRTLRSVRLPLVALAVGAGAYLLGRSGSPACDPTSPWQWHAVWHGAVAVAVATWTERTLRPDGRVDIKLRLRNLRNRNVVA
jgi:hypothetical protein